MAEVRMTLDEYRDLLKLIDSERESEGASLADRTETKTKTSKRKISRYQREFGRQLKIAMSQATLKNGSYRKGMNQKKVFDKAHKMTRKALK